MRPSRRVTCLVVGATVLALAASVAFAQRRGFGREFGRRGGVRLRTAEHKDPSFSFCRLMYTSVRREPSGSGWSTDYPYGDINFMVRFSELTMADVKKDQQGDPVHWVVRLADEALFDCPFLMTSDVGTIGFRDEEVVQLREYLLKGGFLWVDDFWGDAAWEQWEQEISRVLPPAQYPIVDAAPDHPIFKSLFQISKVPQITNIGFWRRVGGGRTTSERGEESAVPHLRIISDENDRVMVVMTHNTDVADSWEREGEDKEFFYQFSPDGYALGINVLLYAMTH